MLKNIFSRISGYLTNSKIEPRKRILNVMLISVCVASLVCLVPIIINGVDTAWLNIALAFTCALAQFINLRYKKIDAAGILVAVTTIVLFLPAMYFTQGGYHSGMPLWFVASSIAFFIMTPERIRFYIIALSIAVDTGCMMIEALRPEFVTKLADEAAIRLDIIISFLGGTILLLLITIVFISTEKSQREKLSRQKDELDENRVKLEHALQYDSLTGIANRYSYNRRVAELETAPLSENLIVISADVDGLKKANDTIGHDAGDEIIKGAAQVLSETFSAYGQVFRTGGDEFQAIIQTEKPLEELREELRSNVNAWRGKLNDKLQISAGYAENREIRAAGFHELEKISDRRMYEAKQDHYRRAGIQKLNEGYGREGQYRRAILQDAVAFCEVNLSRDEFVTAVAHSGEGHSVDFFESIGIAPVSRFSEFVELFAKVVVPESQAAYNDFFNTERLLDCYRRDELEQTCDCWVDDPNGKRRLSRAIILIGEHENTHDVIALCIFKDITDKQAAG